MIVIMWVLSQTIKLVGNWDNTLMAHLIISVDQFTNVIKHLKVVLTAVQNPFLIFCNII